ncbi:MAG TPA: hypothetical protein VKZ53_02455 [Candidatus Angelobacter sp.]|nr:hypothetical protein [Candidatus Angelobacter sp.]
MRSGNEMRQALLSHLPPAADLETYRKQIAATLEKNRKKNRLERVLANLFWLFCAGYATVHLWFDNLGPQFPRTPFLACIFMLLGGVELLKHHIHAAQVETQKDIKQLHVQILELQSAFEESQREANEA